MNKIVSRNTLLISLITASILLSVLVIKKPLKQQNDYEVNNDIESHEVITVDDNEIVRTNNEPVTTKTVNLISDNDSNNQDKEEPIDESGNLLVPFDQAYPEAFVSGEFEYDDRSILIKLENDLDPDKVLKGSGIDKTALMFQVSSGTWYEGFVLAGKDIKSVIENVRSIDGVISAEYNFIWETTDDTGIESLELDNNAKYSEQSYLEQCGIKEAWNYQLTNNLPIAGAGIVVAVIDTGVDYNHEDLVNNMWINQGEIPDNGIDDDGNGYIDDYYGVDMVKERENGLDDNGHGTHVAGIIAAVNNSVGTVGVAFNSKIMTVKAGDSSGQFTQSRIANAIIYAHNNGADVINMSFGGKDFSTAVQDALEFAYTDSILVASAGNDGLINEKIKHHLWEVSPTYPAALSYVLGVMSVGESGRESLFTNYDGEETSHYEYEVYATGEQIISTTPGNKYATWSGTSMAAPVISGIAAMLRSSYTDRSMYPSKFIYGQIVSTNNVQALCCKPGDAGHGDHNIPYIVNAYKALTTTPTPEVSLSDYAVFDTEGLSEKNNGDGVIDSGEVLALGFELWNKWGMAKDTTVSIQSLSEGGVVNPYITFSTSLTGTYGTTASINYGDIGTYSSKDAGRIVENNEITGWQNPFYVKIADDCPNDTSIVINVNISEKNGLDNDDSTTYTSKERKITLSVRNGVILPSIIREDQTWTADNYYILSNSLYIREGVTVNVEPGTKIQFWTNDAEDPYAQTSIVSLQAEGTINFNGDRDNHIEIFPSELMYKYRVQIFGHANFNYCDIKNAYFMDNGGSKSVDSINNCEFTTTIRNVLSYRELTSSGVQQSALPMRIECNIPINNCSFYNIGSPKWQATAILYGTFNNCAFIDSRIEFIPNSKFNSCLFYGNNNSYDGYSGSVSSLTPQETILTNFRVTSIYRDNETGTTYACLDFSNDILPYNESISCKDIDDFLNSFGARVVSADNEKLKDLFIKLEVDGYDMINYANYVIVDKDGNAFDIDGKPIILDGIVQDMYGVEHSLSEDGVKLSEGKYITFYRNYDELYKTYIKEDQLGKFYLSFLVEIPGNIYVEEIGLNESNITIDKEIQYQIISNPYPNSGKPLIYESQNTDIITVDENGLISPHDYGTADVLVYSDDRGVYSILTVNVVEEIPLESITASLDNTRINVGETITLSYVLLPENTTKQGVHFVSSDPTVATIDQNGIITALKPGITRISVISNHDNEISDTIDLTVVKLIENMSYDSSTYLTDTSKDDGIDFYPSISPNGYTEKLIWDSSNPEVAYVDENGKLVKLKEGVAVLHVKSEDTEKEREIILIINDTKVESTIKKVRNNNYHGLYILFENGELWNIQKTQKGLHTSTRDIESNDIVDFEYNGFLCTLNNDGDAYIDGQYLASNVKKLASSSQDYYNTPIFILKNDGTVWELDFNSGTADPSYLTQLGISDVNDILASGYYVLCLQNNGDLYGGQQNPVYIMSGVIGLDDYCSDDSNNPRFYNDQYVYQVSFGYGDPSYYQQYPMPQNNNDLTITGQYFYQNGTLYQLLSEWELENNNCVYPVVSNEVIKAFGNQTILQKNDYKIFDFSSQKEIPVGVKKNYSEFTYTTNISDDNILTSPVLIFDFNDAIETDNQNLSSLKMTCDGQNVAVKSQIYLDKILIEPTLGFKNDSTYTLECPNFNIVNIFGDKVYPDNGYWQNHPLNINFVYHDTSSATENTDEMNAENRGTNRNTFVETLINESVTRFYWSIDELFEKHNDFILTGINRRFTNNAIINRLVETNIDDSWFRIQSAETPQYSEYSIAYNYWGTNNESLINRQMVDFDDYRTLCNLNPSPWLTEAPSDVWPFIVDAGVMNANGEKVTTVGNEAVTFYVEFNRTMDTDVDLDFRFGSSYPYGEYTVTEGVWVSDTRWEGIYVINTRIESGVQYMNISNAYSGDEQHLKFFADRGRFTFNIDMSSALSMNLRANPTNTGIDLDWDQDDFETLIGYNIYRSDKENGLYNKLNSIVIPVGEEEFFDDTVEPGNVYYYYFTVVQSDMTESTPSGRVVVQAKDTMAPDIYHSPVQTAFTGTNLVISATVVDNVEVRSVKLYYRTTGTETYKSVEMVKNNDKYYGTIPSTDITLDGIEYYIEAFDGVLYQYKGSADAPFSIIIKQSITNDQLGDVDGDGKITNKDALMILQHINNLITLTPEQFTRADIDKSGELSAFEALRILKYVSGKITSILG